VINPWHNVFACASLHCQLQNSKITSLNEWISDVLRTKLLEGIHDLCKHTIKSKQTRLIKFKNLKTELQVAIFCVM